ncbi:MAG: AI-2E family transporter [Saprospiraceae bacterium]
MRTNHLLGILGAAAVLAVAYYFSDIVAYLLIAGVLAMLGRPIKHFFERRIRFRGWKMGPAGATVLTMLSFYLVIAGLLMLFVPTIMAQVQHLASVDYSALGEKLKGPFTDWDTQLHQVGLLAPDQSLGKRTQELLSGWFKPTMLSDFVGGFLATAGNVAVAFASISFILFFFLKDDSLSVSILHAFVPAKLESKLANAVEDSGVMLQRYFTGLALQTLAFMAIASLALWLFGVPNALLIGVMGGLFNIVPYIGPIMGIVLGCFFTLSYYIEAEFSMLAPQLLKVAGAFAITQAVDNNFVGPYITSTSIKAHPLEIFIVTLVAAKLGGVIGMVVGIPVYTVLRVVARVFFSEFRLVKQWTSQLDEE